jgi:hypothetical protein
MQRSALEWVEEIERLLVSGDGEGKAFHLVSADSRVFGANKKWVRICGFESYQEETFEGKHINGLFRHQRLLPGVKAIEHYGEWNLERFRQQIHECGPPRGAREVMGFEMFDESASFWLETTSFLVSTACAARGVLESTDWFFSLCYMQEGWYQGKWFQMKLRMTPLAWRKPELDGLMNPGAGAAVPQMFLVELGESNTGLARDVGIEIPGEGQAGAEEDETPGPLSGFSRCVARKKANARVSGSR